MLFFRKCSKEFMSTYGASSFLYKAQISRTDVQFSSNVVKYSMLSPSKTTESDKVRCNVQEVEYGTDALVDVSRPDDSLLSDYSLCNFDLMDCPSAKPGTS